MPWAAQDLSVAECDTCRKQRMVSGDWVHATQMLRAAGWHHWKGVTLGGEVREVILCALCAREEKKKKRNTATQDQEALPLNWEDWRSHGSGEGISSR